MILTGTTYFNGETYIPDLVPVDEQHSAGTTYGLLALETSIKTYEPKFLKLILGTDLYKDYVAHSTEARWVAFAAQLVDGDYSPIAGYVFWYHWKALCHPQSGNGSSISIPKDTVVLPFTERTIPAWNTMADYMVDFLDWLDENASTYETDTLSIDRSHWDTLLSHANCFGI